MTELLLKAFVKDYKNTGDQAVRERYGMFAGITGIILNILLFAAKFIAGALCGSIAITADAFNNLSDAGSSVVTLVGFKLAGQKPDVSHPFGHGRLEYISGLVVSGIIFVMGYELLHSSIEKIISPESVGFSWLAVIVMFIAIAVKLFMAYLNLSLSKRIDSAAMKATAFDSISDVAATSAVLIGTVIGAAFKISLDGWLGLAVACFIMFAGYKAAKETIGPLLGQAPDKELVADIEKTVLAHPEICGIHDLIVHDYGPGRLMITLHAEVPADGDLVALHDVIDNAENEIAKKLNCHATIHLDPVAVNDPQTEKCKELVKEIVAGISSDLTIHDFRIVAGPTHTNLLFDVCVPFGCKLTDAEIDAAVRKKVREIKGNYFAVPTVERSYI